MYILLNNKIVFSSFENITLSELINTISLKVGLENDELYLTKNGRKVEDNICFNKDDYIHVIPRLPGGKGGFGSMLRAIGAQIEKTTNREACRDLSGRRLRDINEEQRLKNWINQQADREKEAAARKKKKLERLCEQPKHDFKDEAYDKERSALPEEVEEAVVHGLKASCSSKRNNNKDIKAVKNKKRKLWFDDNIDDLSSSNDDDSDDDEEKEQQTSSDHSNEISSVLEEKSPNNGKTPNETKIITQESSESEANELKEQKGIN